MPKYRKKPVEVEARQLTGDYDEDLIIMEWCGGQFPHEAFQDEMLFYISTLEGEMYAQPGDYIIKEPFPTTDRTFYPCKPDIFEATYEPVVSCGECGYDFDDELEGCDDCVEQKEK